MRDKKNPAMNSTWRIALGLLTLAQVSAAHAQEADYLTEEDVFLDVPVASGASRFPQALNKAPVSVIIIDREMIKAAGVLEVPDLFRLLPGFQVYSAAYNHPVFNYHTLPDGFPSRMEVRIDGRSVYEPFTNTVFWIVQGLEVEDIDYIEVVRGSNVSAYGANAINGSINIVTRSPVAAPGLTLRGAAGSNDTENLSIGYSGTHEAVSYRISGRHRQNSGFGSFEGQDLDDDSEAWSVTGNLLWTPSLRDKVSVQLGYSDSDFTFDQGNSNVELDELFPWDIQYSYQHVDWQHQINHQHSLRVALTHSRNEINAIEREALLSELIGLPPGLIWPGLDDFELVLGIDDGYSERYDLELSHTGESGERLKFDWGASARRDRAKSQLHFSTESSVSENYYRLFGNAEYDALDWLTLNAGASLSYNDTVKDHNSWRLSANFHVNANNTLRFALSRATRAPTLLTANYFRTINNGGVVYDLDLISDEDIAEEERKGAELGYFGYFFGGKLTTDLKLFYEDNEHLIDVQTDRDYRGPLSVDNEVAFMTNSLQSEDYGFEAYVNWRPDQAWLITAQYTWMDIDAEHARRINPDRISDRSDAVAENMASMMVNRAFGHGFHGAFTWYYQSEINWKSGPPVEDYDRLDVNLRKEFQFERFSGRVEFIAQNIFGDDYADYRPFHEFDSRYYIRLVTEF
ncbi:TonB-dependent receptor plug domain-containing protein [Pseudohalioglobus sediminis]|uniref:TonB-dependent receptor plug domain-containing protein n=1 Tax=Pseudohalioglobus sediminis TaxID=2606449 RepID=A0A5B0X1D1_9GAMM|nr:TonB-dependent receptor plug domain-containing protein [Pseudohalioglobus sediminis]KAA1193086.1 TonB-dependent receptor plug domain-containing protein [Pseudohalioglobus sediminis]